MSYLLCQGYVRHGKGENRVVTVDAFAHKLNEYIRLYQPIQFGTITLEPDALYQYGTLEQIQLDEHKARWAFQFRHAETRDVMTIDIPFSSLTLTHDIEYTVDDETKGKVSYPVFYVTAQHEKEQTVTYFAGSERLVSRPLDCIAEFYVRSYEVGKDMKLPQRLSCTFSR